MAVGTVSSVDQDVWQLIQTNTPSTATTSFTSISGYKRLMVVWKALRTGSNTFTWLRVNNNSTTGSYACMLAYTSAQNNDAETLMYLSGVSTTTHSGLIVFENTNQPYPHPVSNYASNTASQFSGAILLSEAITRIDISNLANSNFTSGTVELWGVPA